MSHVAPVYEQAAPGLVVASDRTRSRFLRILGNDIASRLLPALTGPGPIETAYYAMLTLQRLAGEDDVVPAAAVSLAASYSDAIRRALPLLSEAEASQSRAILDQCHDDRMPPSESMKRLRALAAGTMRAIVDGRIEGAESATLHQDIVALEHRWLDATAAPPENAAAQAEVSEPAVTISALSKHLSAHVGAAIEVLEARALAGGRSKTTRFIRTAPGGSLPEMMVMRQDGFGHIATSVVDEHALLATLADRGLPTPRMILCEPAPSALGKPFLLMERLPGTPAGTFSAFAVTDTAFILETAAALARLHAIDPATTALSGQASRAQFERSLRAMIDEHEAKWRAEAIDPSPIFEHGFAWARAQVAALPDPSVIVHGDYRPHNFLAEDGCLTALLDWEFAHFGDGAEDLAYIRPTIEPVMPWADYLAAYRAAGGQPCEERTLIFYDVWNVLRLAALGAGAVRAFVDGATDDFCQGAGGYFTKPLFERNLSLLLRRADALPSQTASR